jgi:hypothetical protein
VHRIDVAKHERAAQRRDERLAADLGISRVPGKGLPREESRLRSTRALDALGNRNGDRCSDAHRCSRVITPPRRDR